MRFSLNFCVFGLLGFFFFFLLLSSFSLYKACPSRLHMCNFCLKSDSNYTFVCICARMRVLVFKLVFGTFQLTSSMQKFWSPTFAWSPSLLVRGSGKKVLFFHCLESCFVGNLV